MENTQEMRMGTVEAQFADIIWLNEPLSSRELVTLCAEKLNWKKSTTYTVLKKLCDRGIFQNKDSVVTSLISKEEFESLQSRKFVEESFGGSLPAFIAAFTKKQKLSPDEIAEIRKVIETAKEVGVCTICLSGSLT